MLLEANMPVSCFLAALLRMSRQYRQHWRKLLEGSSRYLVDEIEQLTDVVGDRRDVGVGPLQVLLVYLANPLRVEIIINFWKYPG